MPKSYQKFYGAFLAWKTVSKLSVEDIQTAVDSAVKAAGGVVDDAVKDTFGVGLGEYYTTVVDSVKAVVFTGYGLYKAGAFLSAAMPIIITIAEKTVTPAMTAMAALSQNKYILPITLMIATIQGADAPLDRPNHNELVELESPIATDDWICV